MARMSSYATAQEPGPKAGVKRVRIRHFAQAKQAGERITALTSYDTLTAQIFDEAGIDLPL
ncbi:MAG: 3-methyl-2-oxobutanoate hydroxymethyltransferase, partial [Pseudoclavibacter sp.]|nr:3-methyl-2-oxobutanoate hydroxymethyltransferase [Pseudoclavibacter sp.]